jgi:HK97 gp10 family phage protein
MSISASITTEVSTASIDALILRFALIPALIEKYLVLIEGDAKQLAPVDTGALRESIAHTLEGLAGEVTAGNDAVDYASFVEYGTSRQPGHAFMRPAIERYVPGFLLELQALIGGV